MSMRTTPAPKKPASQDWHPADIVAAIWKRRSSLIRLSRLNGYADGSLRLALSRPWPKAEGIIAKFLNLTPQEIWPSRYDANGEPNRPLGNPNWLKDSTGRDRTAIHRRKAA